MAADDRDTDRERARLQEIAWGSGSTPTEAARARIALTDLGRRPVPRTVRPGSAASVTPSVAPATPGRAGSSEHAESPEGAEAPASMVDGPPVDAERDDDLPGDMPGTAAVPPLTDHGVEATAPDQGDPGLPSGGPGHGADVPSGWIRARDRAVRVLRSARTRPWVAGGLAAAIVVAFGTGLVIGTVHPAVPSSPSVTPTAGTVTLEQLLDAPQTYADQIPGSLEAPVRLHSTRLIYTNRSLSGDDAATPWNVWAGVGTDRGTVCLVATANRMEASTACFPREDALHGAVSMTAQSLSGTLTLELSGGGVQGRVAQSF
ncbi:hypothetical protein DEJ13_09055 [Curtobacterium sp. MCLR17_007]|uniref:hypothetical protein n=1 Tax=Curtobacterium sp. MCLR17_007 TaxID=2175648 RepID=UPI000DA9C3DA|nr:hypothetical protein [Curtobacterium sp. MCLR17_007]WIB58628.1 hypothetical protein DEJ13_09055 [Curtobacterium sp. MCLR17_007]